MFHGDACTRVNCPVFPSNVSKHSREKSTIIQDDFYFLERWYRVYLLKKSYMLGTLTHEWRTRESAPAH